MAKVSKRLAAIRSGELKLDLCFPTFHLPKPVTRGSSVSWSPAQASQLKALRQSRGLSQQKLAGILGMTRRRYSNVEWPSDSNPTKPTASELSAITAFFSK